MAHQYSTNSQKPPMKLESSPRKVPSSLVKTNSAKPSRNAPLLNRSMTLKQLTPSTNASAGSRTTTARPPRHYVPPRAKAIDSDRISLYSTGTTRTG